MSFVNFLGLDDPGYGNFAKGILYVIYEMLWKVVCAVGKFVDAITGLFYKLAGLDYLGSGREELVEQEDLLSQMFNQNIISNVSLFMILGSVLLMAVFGTIAVLKRMYFSKGEVKSSADIITNMIMGSVFLIFLSPLAMFAISSISTVTTIIAELFGSNMNVSLADLMFNSSFSGDPVAAYNEIYSAMAPAGTEWVNITSWTEMTNTDFLFELTYGGAVTTEFYWYVFLIGGGLVTYNVVVLAIKLIKRLFNVVVLYLLGPVYVAKMVDDGGIKFREWKNKAVAELVSIVGMVVGFMVLLSLVGMIDDIELIKETVGAVPPGGDMGLVGMADPAIEEPTINETAVLINNLAKMLMLVAGTSVAKDTGDLLANIFKNPDNANTALLEGIFDRLGNREVKSSSNQSTNNAPRTRVITKSTTTTRKIVDYSDDSRTSGNKPSVNISNNQRNNFQTNVTNNDRKTINMQNRTNVSLNEVGGRSAAAGVKVGAPRATSSSETGIKSNAADILNQTFAGYKSESDKLRNEWEFVKNGNSSSSKEVVKNFESASKDLDSAISAGEQSRIKTSMNQYVDAYKKEEKVAKEGYKDFAGKSAKLSNDLTMKQQQELRNISSAYKKAQVDYGKTSRRLSEVSQGNMSASEALRVKEKADKQRAKLMEASSKANNFYNNQKKGV
jgi:hypothetical protein